MLVQVLDEVLREFWVEHRKVNEKGEIEGILEGIVGKDVTGKGMFSYLLAFFLHDSS